MSLIAIYYTLVGMARLKMDLSQNTDFLLFSSQTN